MGERRRCPYCKRLFVPNPRVGDRQRTCGREGCRKAHKRQYDEEWRKKHPDYFRGSYRQQKQLYGTRAAYKRQYRQEHPEYVRRNAAYVRACRERRHQGDVSPTSCDLRVTVCGEKTSVAVTRVSHTSRDIFVNLSKIESSPPVAPVSPTSFDGAAAATALP